MQFCHVQLWNGIRRTLQPLRVANPLTCSNPCVKLAFCWLSKTSNPRSGADMCDSSYCSRFKHKQDVCLGAHVREHCDDYVVFNVVFVCFCHVFTFSGALTWYHPWSLRDTVSGPANIETKSRKAWKGMERHHLAHDKPIQHKKFRNAQSRRACFTNLGPTRVRTSAPQLLRSRSFTMVHQARQTGVSSYMFFWSSIRVK